MTKKAKSDEEKNIHSKVSTEGSSKESSKEIPIGDEDGESMDASIERQDASIEKQDASAEKLKEAEAKAAAYLDQLQRVQAEFSNYRKRMDRERQSLKDWLHGQMVLELLPVLDDLDRLVQSQENQNGIDQTGIKQKAIDTEVVRLIQQKFQKILKDRGLQEIESIGHLFDPDLHEAVGVEHTDEEKAGRVLEEWEKGYKIGEKLLRPSRVKVGKFEGKAGDEST